jgi:hypothetical protein
MKIIKLVTAVLSVWLFTALPVLAQPAVSGQSNPFGVSPVDMASMHDQSIVLFFVMLTIFSLWSWYKGRLSIGLLILFGALFTSWQEFFGDWGAYLYWNPEFPQLPWGETPFTTPAKPMFIPFSWGWYLTLIYTVLVALLTWVQGKLPRVPKFLVVLVIAGPLFYAYNIYSEGLAADMAWWGYAETFGPYAQGTYAKYPLVWPAIDLVAWSVTILWLLTLKDEQGYWWHERFIGVDRVSAGLKHGLARIGGFILMFNLSCLLIVTIPCILVRIFFGVDSPIVP